MVILYNVQCKMYNVKCTMYNVYLLRCWFVKVRNFLRSLLHYFERKPLYFYYLMALKFDFRVAIVELLAWYLRMKECSIRSSAIISYFLSSYNYGGLNLAVFRKFHHIIISTRYTKTRQVNFWRSDMV